MLNFQFGNGGKWDQEIDEHCQKFREKKGIGHVRGCDGCQVGEADCWRDFCTEKYGYRGGKTRPFFLGQRTLDKAIPNMKED